MRESGILHREGRTGIISGQVESLLMQNGSNSGTSYVTGKIIKEIKIDPTGLPMINPDAAAAQYHTARETQNTSKRRHPLNYPIKTFNPRGPRPSNSGTFEKCQEATGKTSAISPNVFQEPYHCPAMRPLRSMVPAMALRRVLVNHFALAMLTGYCTNSM